MGTVYRPPSTSTERSILLLDLIKVADNNKYSQILLCGDFNLGGIAWENNDITEGEHHMEDSRAFLDVINDCFFNQHVQGLMYNTDSDNPSRLDLVFTNNLVDVENMKYLAPVGKSHHVILEFDYLIRPVARNVKWGVRMYLF